VKEIPLTKGYVTLVPDEDFELLNQWKWYAHVRKSKNGKIHVYAYRFDQNKRTVIRLSDHGGSPYGIRNKENL
jgi:hypothetical protein